MDFAKNLDTVEKVIAELKDESRLLFGTDWEGDISKQIQDAMDDENARLMGTKHPGLIVAGQAFGRMTVSNELLVKARRLRATPIIDAPTSWVYFNWKLEYDANRVESIEGLKNLHILRGLQSLSESGMQWLGNVPIDALIEIRKLGALDEIAQSNPSDFSHTTDQVFDNIDIAFQEHKEKIKELSSKKWKFAGTDIASWLVVGSIEVAAAATGYPVYGLVALAANQVLDTPKLKDIPPSIKKLAEESRELKQSPVGMLFNCSQSKK